jgi:hypothetical protein
MAWGGALYDDFNDIAVDEAGNIFLAGSTKSYGVGNSDILLLKYNSLGTLLWQKTYGGASDDWAMGIKLDDSGNIYLAGSTTSFGTGDADIVVLKLDSSGTVLWQKTWGSASREDSMDIALDGNGNVYVTGFTPGFGPGDVDTFLLKYDVDGNLLWQALWYGSDSDYASNCTTDGEGNIYVTGYTFSFSGGARADAILLKYDTNGALLLQKTWVNSGGGSSGVREAMIDSNGMLVICGMAADINGTWSDAAGIAIHVGGVEGDAAMVMNDVVGTAISAPGTESTPSGTIDTGGGLSDALLMKLNPAGL